MGEDNCCLDSTTQVDKKTNYNDASSLRNGDHSFPNSSTMSTCSEMGSESNSYVNDDVDQDYQYGPGIVSKLRTKFLSISLKQNRGTSVSMRRSCSLENILDPKPNSKSSHGFGAPDRFGGNNSVSIGTSSTWSNLKRAKSMDTLLMNLEKEQSSVMPHPVAETEVDFQKPREPKVIRRKDGPLNRSTVTIADEEFPKPDIVKTYKRMFEPAESKKTNSNSNVRRRPPVLRATAKSGSNSNLKSNQTNAKVNGHVSSKVSPSIKSNVCAKESAVKDIVLKVTSLENHPKIELAEKEVKNKEVETMNKKNANSQLRNDDLIISGTVRAEAIQLRVKDEVAKRNHRSPKPFDTRPSIPLKKPSPLLKTAPPRLTVAQPAVQKTNCNNNASKEQNNIAEKQTFKSVKRQAKNDIKSKIESFVKVDSETAVENATPIIKDPEPQSIAVNGLTKGEIPEDNKKPCPKEPAEAAPEVKVAKRVSQGTGGNNSMVFDFRGKDVVSHLSVSPAPFGCKPVVRRRNVIIDGKESVPYLNGFANGGEVDSDDEDYTDYSVPPPCGLVFEGENVKVGKGSILAKRNKELKIHFDESVEKSTFVYPSESSLLTDDSSSASSSELSSLDDVASETTTKQLSGDPLSSSKLPSNTALNSSGSGGLMSYTPSVLRTVDNFQPGLFRVQDEKKKKAEESSQAEGEEENRERKDPNGDDPDPESTAMLKPADPEFISSWSLSASTSDLLF